MLTFKTFKFSTHWGCKWLHFFFWNTGVKSEEAFKYCVSKTYKRSQCFNVLIYFPTIIKHNIRNEIWSYTQERHIIWQSTIIMSLGFNGCTACNVLFNFYTSLSGCSFHHWPEDKTLRYKRLESDFRSLLYSTEHETRFPFLNLSFRVTINVKYTGIR